MYRTGISNRCQSHISDPLSNDHGIHKAVKLLKKISDQNRQEKLKNQLHAVALRHIICCFLHDDNLVTFPFFILSCKSYKITIY